MQAVFDTPTEQPQNSKFKTQRLFLKTQKNLCTFFPRETGAFIALLPLICRYQRLFSEKNFEFNEDGFYPKLTPPDRYYYTQ